MPRREPGHRQRLRYFGVGKPQGLYRPKRASSRSSSGPPRTPHEARHGGTSAQPARRHDARRPRRRGAQVSVTAPSRGRSTPTPGEAAGPRTCIPAPGPPVSAETRNPGTAGIGMRENCGPVRVDGDRGGSGSAGEITVVGSIAPSEPPSRVPAQPQAAKPRRVRGGHAPGEAWGVHRHEHDAVPPASCAPRGRLPATIADVAGNFGGLERGRLSGRDTYQGPDVRGQNEV